MILGNKRTLLCSLGFSLVAGGCLIGPDYERPETMAETATQFIHAKEDARETGELPAVGRWWESFGDPVTADLVREVLESNYDLKAAAARVLQSQAALAQARGQLLPDVSYSIGRDRSKRYFDFGGGGDSLFITDPNTGVPIGEIPGIGGAFSPLTTTWNHGVSVSYLVDLWGKLRRSERAAWADMLAAEANQEALVNSLVATVIQARIDIAMAQRRLAIAKANTESRQRTFDITERRYRGGLVGPVDVRLARANLESARAQEPAVELSLAMARHALDVLVGRQPGVSPDLPEQLPPMPTLEAVPVGVPAALLDRRPDVRAAEFSLRAANEQIGASMAQLYPDLTLTGSYGASSSRFEDIWDRDFEIYSAITGLAAPIWKGGQIRAQIRRARARYAELAAAYAGVVLKAMQEVEDALTAQQLLQVQVEHTRLQYEESQAAEELSRRRYERGVESLLTVLEAERTRRIAEEQLTIVEGQIWTTRVTLHLALGGDWVGPEPTEKLMVKK
ncbi:MAG: efflux transporter outer membrane subunit [Planctomycetota bacterium]|jgi:NodT family efflux transporter outer membrane factor (OMF) lipoprotein